MSWLFVVFFFFSGYGDHRDLHVLTHSFPTRRSSDLWASASAGAALRFRAASPNSMLVSRRSGVNRSMSACPTSAVTGGAPSSSAANVTTTKPPSCRSEEHTSELQSLMRISYAVFCLKKKKTKNNTLTHYNPVL